MSKTNYDHLRELCADNVEAMEFIEAAEEEAGRLSDELSEATDEIDERQKIIDAFGDPRDYHEVDLGLDTLHYKLENGNLRISSQLRTWINSVKKQNCAGVEMF